jgi:arylsulfatase A-like enzyme
MVNPEHSQIQAGVKTSSFVGRLYGLLASRAWTLIMLGAIICTLAVKLFHAWRYSLINEYFDWVLADVSVLLCVEVVLSVICFRQPRRRVIRTAIIVAMIVCTWSVMNAGWLIRTGTQILPSVFLPLIRSPINTLHIVLINIIKIPLAAVILFVPAFTILGFSISVLVKPVSLVYNRKRFVIRITISVIIILAAVLLRGLGVKRGSPQIISAGLRYNSQLRTIISFFVLDAGRLARADFINAKREIPSFDQVTLTLKTQQINHNIVIVILEGVQYGYTSLADRRNNLTPHLATLAEDGVEFANARSSMTHTTKSLFALLTGRFPSASHDLAEAVPALKPYAGLATILKSQLGFRTAFFQSAKGDFESRPGLVYNLGFDKFWARDDLNDPNKFIGYLACDEFSMLGPITEWIKADDTPFFVAILCSVTHDPHEVPEWFAEPAKEPLERYRQSVSYTDKFIAVLDEELAKLKLTDKTFFCVIGDHGEAFGEHGLLGHERIAFDEALQIPFVMRAPLLIKGGMKVIRPVGSVDLTPTLLMLLAFEIEDGGFDGVNALVDMPEDRKAYFSDWMQQGPAGFVRGNYKFIYEPADKTVCAYDLDKDRAELDRIELPEQESQKIAEEIIRWRRNTIFRINQQRTGKVILFEQWVCRWMNRVSWAKYQPKMEH